MYVRWARTLGVALIGVLLFAGAYAWAQQGPRPGAGSWAHRGHAFHGAVMGTVTSASDGTIVLNTRSGRSLTIHTTSDTQLVSRVQPRLTDLQSGDFVAVVASTGTNGTVSARSVHAVAATLAPAGGPAGRPASSGGAATFGHRWTHGRGGRFGPGGRGRMLGHGLLSSGLWARGAGTVVVTGRLVGAPANNVIAVALPAGPPLRVAVPANAQLSRLASAPVGSLGVGARVLVHGRPNADRSIAATSIFVLPPQTR